MHAWFDVSAGVAGDMLLGSLLDAGADPDGVQAAIDAVAPGSVRLESEPVVRGGQRGVKARVRVLVEDPPHRRWATIRTTLNDAALAEQTRAWALAAFARLADAEARAHGIDAEDVHFHEVGALDSIADVVGTCEALRGLGVTSVSASPVRLGAGRVRAAHGDIPVPVPAVAELAVGWQVYATPERDAAHGHGHGAHEHDHDQEPHNHDSHAHEHGPHEHDLHEHNHGSHEHGPHEDDHGAHVHDHNHDTQEHDHGAHAHDHAHAHGAHEHDHDHGAHEHDHDHAVHDHGHGPHVHGDHHDTPAVVTTAGSVGELATPTGLAVIRALAQRCEPLPALTVRAVGVGAGGKDFAGWPNVVRVLLGERPDGSDPAAPGAEVDRGRAEADDVPATTLVELRANVDDLDGRLWPGVLQACLDAGAADAWLVPIVMKKGRPAHTVHALVDAAHHDAVVEVILTRTSTLGVRGDEVRRSVLERGWSDVAIGDATVRIKVGHRDGRIVHATPEFSSVQALGAALGIDESDALQRATGALAAAGLLPGRPYPSATRLTAPEGGAHP